MKKYLFVLLSTLYSFSAVGQTDIKSSANQNTQYVKLKYFHKDTLSYVQHNFIDNKQIVIGSVPITMRNGD
jgi:flavorubredoxin